MAEAEVLVVARALGFEQVAAETQRAVAALEKLSGATKLLSGGSILRNLTRDFSAIESRLAQLRRDFRTTAEYASGKLGSGLNASLSESLASPALVTKFRERGIELGRALQAGMNSVLQQAPVLRMPTMSGNGGGGGGGGSGGGGPVPVPASGGRRDPVSRHIDHYSTVLAGTIVGDAARRVTESVFDQAGALAQTRAQLKSQGLSDAEIADVEKESRATSAKYRAASVPRLMHSYGEFRTVFGDPKDAKKFLPISAELDVALKNLRSSETWAKDIDPEGASLDLARSIEMRGDANDRKKARNDIDLMLKGISAFKGQLQPSDYALTFKYARGALRGYSDDFLFTIMPTLMAEFKTRGGRAGPAGTALQAFYSATAKGKMTKSQREAWGDFGLLDENGRAVDLDLARSNPYLWWQKDVAPKLKGMSEEKQRDKISQLFPGAISEQMANIFNAPQRLAKDRQNILAASSLDKLQNDFANAPTQAMAEFSSQFRNLLAAIGDPAMPAAISSLKGMASIFSTLTQSMHDSPAATGLGLAVGVGGIGYGLYRALPFLMRSPLGRLTLGALTGGLVGGGLEGLLIGGALGLGVGGVPEAGAAKVAPGLTRLGRVMSFKGFGGGLAGLLTGAAARMAKWVRFMGPLKTALGMAGKLAGAVARAIPGVAVFEAFDFFSNSEGGKAWGGFVGDEAKYFWDWVTGKDRKTLDADKARVIESHRRANEKLLAAIGIEPDLPLAVKTQRRLDAYHRHRALHPYGENVSDIPLPIRRPKVDANGNPLPPNFFGLGDSMPSIGRRRANALLRSGQNEAASGPVPVQIVNTNKPMPPPVINVTNNINVTASGLGGVAGAIAGAVGPATSSAVNNALSDQHH